jgi:FkbM family methyltransferase
MFRTDMKGSFKRALHSFGLRVVNVRLRWGLDVYDDIRRIVNDVDTIETVFDVGANIGMTALRMLKEYPKAKIYSFEPVRSTFTQLVDNTRRHGRIECQMIGLGKTVGQATCLLHSDHQKNSLIEGLSDRLHAEPIGDEIIHLETLDSVTKKLDVSSIDLLKIDTEGGDLAVLQGASGLLARKSIRFVYFEFHYLLPNESTQRLGNLVEIATFLRAFDYRFITTYTDSVHGWENLGTYNALFMLDDGRYRWDA